VGLVVDGSNIYIQRRTGQNAADAAALAGARTLLYATGSAQVSNISAAIAQYATANAFGIQPSVPCAYFVDSTATAIAGAGIINDGSLPSCPGVSSSIPATASGVHVDTRISFPTYVMGMFNLLSETADSHATAQVGVLSASDTRAAPLIACGGGGGTGFDALRLTTQTPVVVTTTPGVLAATPTALPVISNPQVTTDQLLVTPVGVATPPAYVVNPARDGTIYYIKGQTISTSNGSNCGASGFHGAAATVQPTPYIQDAASATPAVIAGQTGNAVPQISQRVATSGACVAGTDPANQWSQGQPGCVMILPLVDSSSGLDFNIQAWAAFYVWCSRSTGSGCQEFSGQLLANWPAATGPAVNTWTFGARGGITVVHLTQ
jgi:Putative Flp pilus-assembly TadE/G-like